MDQLQSLLNLVATPMQRRLILDLVSIFDKVNSTGYLYHLELLFSRIENNDVELSSALAEIFILVESQCYELALSYGITLEPDLDVRTLYTVVDAITSIEDIEDKRWVIEQLKNDSEDIDKIVSLLSYHNATIPDDIFYESITRVKPSVISKLFEITSVGIEELELSEFDIKPSIKKILSLIKVLNTRYQNTNKLEKFYVEKMIKNNIPLGLLFENYFSIDVLGEVTNDKIEEYNINDFIQDNDIDSIAMNMLGLCYISRDGVINPQLFIKNNIEKFINEASTISKVILLINEYLNKILLLEQQEGGQYAG